MKKKIIEIMVNYYVYLSIGIPTSILLFKYWNSVKGFVFMMSTNK